MNSRTDSTVNITIDSMQLSVDPSMTIIQAARANGISVPHFCWHPELSVAGNCRICLVEVEKLPKLVIACATQVSEGMVVHTRSPKVINGREAVMEFLLINHPLDCPICDEAGECKLQDYAYKHSVGFSRFDEDKVHKPKRQALGPNIMLDMERCIMCSRCVRFCEEIAGKPQLTFANRSDHVILTTAPGEELNNPYAMNTIDICPVGALTSRDFRFKARVWEMSATDTICPGCSRGCNMHSWVRNNEILRNTPRQNPEVNSYWMCDHGRLSTFREVNSAERIVTPLLRKGEELAEVGWDEAIAAAASGLKSFRKSEIAALGSPFATNEENFLFRKFVQEVLGAKSMDYIPRIKEGDEDDILVKADKTPNSRGVEELGIRSEDHERGLQGIIDGVNNGAIKVLYSLDGDLGSVFDQDLLGKLELVVVHSPVTNGTTASADIVFPLATYAEKNGTFTAFDGRVQRIRPSVAVLETDRALDGFAMSRLDRFGTQFDRWAKGQRRDARPAWKVITALANLMGKKYRYSTVEDVFNQMAQTTAAFRGMTYAKIGSKGLRLEGATAPAAVEAR